MAIFGYLVAGSQCEVHVMAKKKTDKDNAAGIPAALLKKPKDKKKVRPKAKQRQGLTNAELLELAKTNKPPQSWYDEDFTGLW
jgi:hypothetical protein